MPENENPVVEAAADTAASAPKVDMPAGAAQPKVGLKMPPPVTTPAAERFSVRPREQAIKTITEHKFAGNPKSAVVELARQLALALIAEHPEDVAGIET